MEEKKTGRRRMSLAPAITLACAATLMLGMLGGCSAGGEGGGTGAPASPEASAAKTLVKTASNDLVLANMADSAHDGVLTISTGDPASAEFIQSLEDHTGFAIDDITITVDVTSSTGAVLGAGGETASQPVYTIESLDAKVGSQEVSYTAKEGFK